MQAFVSGLAAQCERHQLEAELILVEWNPPTDQECLIDALMARNALVRDPRHRRPKRAPQ